MLVLLTLLFRLYGWSQLLYSYFAPQIVAVEVSDEHPAMISEIVDNYTNFDLSLTNITHFMSVLRELISSVN